jgi:hypothetical protein
MQYSRLLTSCMLLFIKCFPQDFSLNHLCLSLPTSSGKYVVYTRQCHLCIQLRGFLFSWLKIQGQINLTTKLGELPAFRLATYKYRESQPACCVEISGEIGAWKECHLTNKNEIIQKFTMTPPSSLCVAAWLRFQSPAGQAPIAAPNSKHRAWSLAFL